MRTLLKNLFYQILVVFALLFTSNAIANCEVGDLYCSNTQQAVNNALAEDQSRRESYAEEKYQREMTEIQQEQVNQQFLERQQEQASDCLISGISFVC